MSKRDIELVMIAMTTTPGHAGATYQLPEPVMLRYAQLVRQDTLEQYRSTINDLLSVLERAEPDDFGRYQLRSSQYEDFEILMEELRAHSAQLNAIKPSCPPCNGDCNEGRNCPARAA